MDRRSLVQLSLAASLMPAAALAQSSQTSVSMEAKHAADTLAAGTIAFREAKVFRR